MLEKKLTLNLQEGNPPTLNPYVGIDLRSRCLYLALYEPLMRRNAKGVLEPAAADKVEVDSTQTIYTFHLRPQTWSNGEAVTSSHFAEAWKYALNPKSLAPRADLFYLIKNAEKVKKGELPIEAVKISTPDKETLVVELEYPAPYFLDLTASSFFAPLYSVLEKEPSCFNGPFIVGKWVQDREFVLRQNPLYWDLKSVQLKEVCFTMVKDPTTALAMYEKGELDLVGDPFSSLPFDAIPTLMKSGQLKTKLISRIFYILLNTNSFPFQNKSIRKALGLSLNRSELTKHLFFGEVPALSHLPKTLSMVDNDKLEHPKEESKALFEKGLKELQLTRETFPKIVFSYANLSGQKKFAEFVQGQWKENLGIDIDVVCSEWNIHVVNLRNKNYQMGTIHLTTLYQDPLFYLNLFRDKKNFSNYSGWEDPSYRALLEKSEKTTDKNSRNQFLEQAERVLFDEMPVIPIFTQNLQYLIRNNIDLVILDVGVYDFKWTRKN